MKRLYSLFCLLTALIVLGVGNASAQLVSDMIFSSSTGNTYTDITGGTMLTNGVTDTGDDQTYANTPIGFTFPYAGGNYTTFMVSCNCGIVLGGTSYSYSSPLSSTSYNNVITPFGRDMRSYSANGSELRYETIGTAPNRVCVIQWKNWAIYGQQNQIMNIQVRLHESGTIEFCYGPSNAGYPNSEYFGECGLRGATSTDFYALKTATSWVTPDRSTELPSTNANRMTWTSTIKPVDGLKYTFINLADADFARYLASSFDVNCGFADPGNTTAAQVITFSAEDLEPAAGNITLTAPTNFQISLDGTTWTSTLTLPYTDGALAAESLYVRFNSPTPEESCVATIAITGGGVSNPLAPTTITVRGSGFLSYCTPAYSTTSYGDIARFSFNNIENISQPTSPVVSNSAANQMYNSYRANAEVGVGQIEVGVETPYQLNLISSSTTFYSSTYPTTIKLYADINRDGEFDAVTELLDSTYVRSDTLIAHGGVVNGSFTVPATGTPINLNTALRVMINSYSAAVSPKFGPCAGPGTSAGLMYCGETEDYDVKFITPSPNQITNISATKMQPAKVGKGTAGVAMMRASISTVGSLNLKNLSSMVFNITGTLNSAGDINPIANAKLYYTGTKTEVDEDAVLLGTITAPTGTMTFTPATALSIPVGVNNYIITYDIATNAGPDAIVDVQLDGIYTSEASTTNKLTESILTEGFTQVSGFKFDGTFSLPSANLNTTPVGGWSSIITSTATTTNTPWRITASTSCPSGIVPVSAPYVAEFYGTGNSTQYRHAMVSPAFSMAGANEPTSFTLKMYRHIYYSSRAGSRLTVYINNAPNLIGATKLQAFPAGSTVGYDSLNTRTDSIPTVANEGWYTYTYNIPASFNGETNYLLFDAGSDYYNNIHIDDVNFGTDAHMAYSDYANIGVPTTPVIIGATNNMLGAINIQTLSSNNPFALNSLTFATDGVVTPSDLLNAKVWYIGQSTTFNAETATLVGTLASVAASNNVITATTPVNFAEGNNFFVVTCDIASTATEGHFADIKITGFNYGRNGENTAVTIPDEKASVEGNREIKAPMNGTYKIAGTEQATRWYPTLSAAVSDLNVLGCSSDINFEIAGDYTDAVPALINNPVEIGGNRTVNIYPVGAARTITITNITDNVYLGALGVDGFNLDGRIGRTGTENALTFQKDNTASAVTLQVAVQASNNVVVRNVNVRGYDNTNAYGISSIASTNVLFTENTVKNVQYGIFVTQNGTTTEETPASNIVISKNIIGGNGEETAKVGHNGIYMNGTNGTTIENNIIYGIGNTETINSYGNFAGMYVFGDARNTVIKNNVIKDIKQYYSGGYGACGIYMENTNAALIAGNRISDISATGDGEYYGIYGIRLDGGNVDPKIYHNTIMLSGNSLPANQDAISACILTSDETGLDVRNNIFVNYMGVLADKETYNYAVYCSDASVGVTHLDYNNYSVDATTGVTNFANFNDTDIADLAAWKLGTNLDAHSASEEMTFTSDLHLDGASALSNNLTCPALPEVTTDIDGIARRVAPQTTQMGVDETDPLLSMVLDLNTTPVTNLCVPTTYDLEVEAAVNGFTDGVVRTVPSTFDFQYQWKKNGTNVDNIKYETSFDEEGNTVLNPVVTNSGEFTANIDAVTTGDFYRVVVSAAGKNLSSATATLAAEAPVVITSPTEDSESELCRENQRTVLSVTAVGTITGYQWQKQVNGAWTNLKGKTSNTLTVELYDATLGAGIYRCAVIGGVNNCNNVANSTVYSATTNLSVVDPVADAEIISPIAIEGRIDVCEGANFSIVLDEEKIKGNVMDYRWEENVMGEWITLENSLVSGSGLIFINSTPSMSGTYRLVVIGSSLCDTKVSVSNAITVNVKPYVTILQHPQTQIVCEGGQIRMSVKSEGEDPTFQWQKNGIDIPVSENATANLPVFLINDAEYEDGGSYSCVVRLNGCTASGADGVLYTNAALVYVMQETRIITQPTDQYAILGGDAVFEVKAHAVGEPEGYMADYQWYKGEVALTDDAKYSGSKASLLTVNDVTAEDIAGTYRVVVQGLCGASETSVEVRIIEAAAQFTEMPASQTVCENENVTFTTLAETTVADGEISYVWHFVDANGVDAVLPTTATTLEVVANAETAGNYYVVATLSPMNSVITSNIATLTVNVAPALVTPIANVAVAEGENATFTAEFSGTQPLQYTWYENGTIIETATEPTLTVTAGAAGEYTYRVEATNACGTVSSEAVLTVTAGGKSGVIDNIAGLTVSEMMPNPINGEGNFTITSTSARNANVILMDAAGKQVANIFNGTIDGAMNLRVDAANLSSGAYFLNVTVDGQTITRSVVVAK